MKKPKSKKAKGNWVEGSVQEFLGLSQADMELIELRLTVSRLLKATREKRKMTQQMLADSLHTSQSRLAKMEAGDPSASLDSLFRSLFSMGYTRRSLARAFQRGRPLEAGKVVGGHLAAEHRRIHQRAV
jgi:DNA-binding XRE family transcriptional regulator